MVSHFVSSMGERIIFPDFFTDTKVIESTT